MDNDIKIISQWIIGLIEQNINYDIIHYTFDQEDGMHLKTYIDYEQKQFNDLSHIYDLNSTFSIKVLNKYIIEENQAWTKYGYFIYLINSLDKIVCKMNITLIKEDGQFYLGSNDFYSQLVPKYSLEYYYNQDREKIEKIDITHFSLAIHSPLTVKNIICKDAVTSFFYKGNNFKNDGFYYAQFPILEVQNPKDFFNRFYFFYVILEDKNGKNFIEKRKIFFDVFDENLIPFQINKKHKQQELKIIDESYPVHISYWKKNMNYNIEYPRNFSIPVNDLDYQNYTIITDSLDNDWTLIFINTGSKIK